jgi:hypothetical protein
MRQLDNGSLEVRQAQVDVVRLPFVTLLARGNIDKAQLGYQCDDAVARLSTPASLKHFSFAFRQHH